MDSLVRFSTLGTGGGGRPFLTTLLTITDHTTTTTPPAANTPPQPSTTPPPPLPTTPTTVTKSVTSLYQLLTFQPGHEEAVDVTSVYYDNLTVAATSPIEGLSLDAEGRGGGGSGLNTPLNAPEASLEPVTAPPLSDQGGYDLSELGWVLPVALVGVLLMLVLAFAFYYGVRKLELRMLRWCYRKCGSCCCCCCAPGGGGGGGGGRVLRGEQYDTLSEETVWTAGSGGKAGKRETVRLREFRERSPSYGVTRNADNEYSGPHSGNAMPMALDER